MSKIKVKNGLVLIEKYDQVRKDRGGSSPFRIESNDNLGIIRHVDETEGVVPEAYKPGVKVYYGPKYAERLTIEGCEIFAMKPENIIAVVEEQLDDDKKQ